MPAPLSVLWGRDEGAQLVNTASLPGTQIRNNMYSGKGCRKFLGKKRRRRKRRRFKDAIPGAGERVQAGHFWSQLSPGIGTKILDSLLAFHGAAAV